MFMFLHDEQLLHGVVGSFLLVQRIVFASTRASVVLPIPRVPENRYVALVLLFVKSDLIAVIAVSCPMISSSVCGRYLLNSVVMVSIVSSSL